MDGNGVTSLLAAAGLAVAALLSAEAAQEAEGEVLASVEVVLGHYEEMQDVYEQTREVTR